MLGTQTALRITFTACILIYPTVIRTCVCVCVCVCLMCDLFPESLRNALLESDAAGKTERSKSYDEGLDNYREEHGR